MGGNSFGEQTAKDLKQSRSTETWWLSGWLWFKCKFAAQLFIHQRPICFHVRDDSTGFARRSCWVVFRYHLQYVCVCVLFLCVFSLKNASLLFYSFHCSYGFVGGNSRHFHHQSFRRSRRRIPRLVTLSMLNKTEAKRRCGKPWETRRMEPRESPKKDVAIGRIYNTLFP